MSFPERTGVESFWSEVFRLYTEDARPMIGGGGPVAQYPWAFRKDLR